MEIPDHLPKAEQMKSVLTFVICMITCLGISSAQTSGTYAKASDATLDGTVNAVFTDTVNLQISGNTFSGSSAKDQRKISGVIYAQGGQVLFTATESGGGYFCVISGVVDGPTFRGAFYDNKGNKGDMSWTRR